MSCDAPDIQRLLASFEHRPTDRVPNFEILIEDKHCSRLLGCAVGHTLGGQGVQSTRWLRKRLLS